MNVWDYLPFGVVVALLSVAVLGYALSYVKRFFVWLKMREDNYLGDNALDSISAYIRLIIVGLFIMAIVATSILLPQDLRDPFLYIGNYIFLFNAFLVFSVFAILAVLGSNAVSNFRKTAEDDEDSVLKPGIMEFWELFIKYGMLILGLMIAALVGIVTIPDDATRDSVFATLHLDAINASNAASEVLSLVIILVVLFVIGKFMEIILDDFKGRSKKFQPRIIDLIKAAVKYSIYWLAFMIVALVVLEMVEPIIAYIVIGFIMAITTIIIIIVGLSPAFRNAISGVILLTTDSINKGDWVQIGNGNTGEVLQQGLVITSLKTRTGDLIDLPNELILQSQIHNYTKLGGTMIRLAMRIQSEQSHDDIEKLLRDTARDLDESGAVSSELAPLKITITDMNSEGIEYTTDIWRKDPVTTESTTSTFLRRFHDIAKTKGIKIIGTRIIH